MPGRSDLVMCILGKCFANPTGMVNLSTPVTLEDAERSHILQTLQQTKGVIGGRAGAAGRLGLARTTLISKMKRLGINRGQGWA